MPSIHILAGDFEEGQKTSTTFGDFNLRMKHEDRTFFRKSRSYNVSRDIIDIRPLDEEDFRSTGATIGWGIAGAALLGPLGAIAGGYLGGRKNTVAFKASLKDGRGFIGVSSKSGFAKLSKHLRAKALSEKADRLDAK